MARGFTQIPGVDFTESFSPVVNEVTLRTLLSVTAHLNLDLKQADVSNAFLNALLSEPTYIELPDGYEDKTTNTKCLKLNKAVYGLVQTSLSWYKKLQHTLSTLMHFKQSKADPCLFTRKVNGSMQYIITYNDDLLFTARQGEAQRIINKFSKFYEIKDLGNASTYLGSQFERD